MDAQRYVGMLSFPLFLLTSAGGQESAQPPTGQEVVASFEGAAAGLFEAYLDTRAARPDQPALGEDAINVAVEGCERFHFFEFTSCSDSERPSAYELDVRKTDSLVSPFAGLIAFEVQRRCTTKRLVYGGFASNKKYNALAPYCLGRSEEECLEAGAKPAPSFRGAHCTGGPETSFNRHEEVTLHYRWSENGWVFEKEETAVSGND